MQRTVATRTGDIGGAVSGPGGGGLRLLAGNGALAGGTK